MKDLNTHITEENQKISAAQKHNLISSNRIAKIQSSVKEKKVIATQRRDSFSGRFSKLEKLD